MKQPYLDGPKIAYRHFVFPDTLVDATGTYDVIWGCGHRPTLEGVCLMVGDAIESCEACAAPALLEPSARRRPSWRSRIAARGLRILNRLLAALIRPANNFPPDRQ